MPTQPLRPHRTTPSHARSTQIIAPSFLRRLIVTRHDAEAQAARIGADCERMLRAVNQPHRREWRDAIGEALLASRLVTSLAQSLSATSEEQAAAQLAELEESAHSSYNRIAEAIAKIVRAVPQSLEDELLLDDARDILALVASRTEAGRKTVPVNADDVAAADADAALGEAAAARPDSAANNRLRPATVLVVDDEESIRKLLEQLLKRLRYDVLTAGNGKAGFDTALAMPVDLVLTDINMPEMHGLNMLRELKGAPGLKHIPVVVVSGEGDMEKVVQSLELGADDYIPKPFDPTLLQARVRSSLARKRMRDLELDHLKRVAQIAAAAEAVDRGVYRPGSLDQVARGQDQVAHLARVFERMVINLTTREDRLAHRLKSLKREVSMFASSGSTTAVRSDYSPFASGDIVANRYQIIGTIGRGGMGMVYLASDSELHEDIAIKVVRTDAIKEDPNLVSRLRSEIRLTRKLAHPNIVRAYDLGEWRGTHFITMEYVQGVSVSSSLDERGRFSPDAVIAIGTQLADALAVAHAQGIIHRDIKPGNLLMTEEGQLKVMDFGLARPMNVQKGDTLTGHVVGTPQYMAPEQLTAGTLDARTDLFAVGVMLYECLTGKPPFDDDNPSEMLRAMVNGTYPPLTSAVPRIPPALDAIVRKLLMLEPGQRVQTAADLSRQLAEIEIA